MSFTRAEQLSIGKKFKLSSGKDYLALIPVPMEKPVKAPFKVKDNLGRAMSKALVDLIKKVGRK